MASSLESVFGMKSEVQNFGTSKSVVDGNQLLFNSDVLTTRRDLYFDQPHKRQTYILIVGITSPKPCKHPPKKPQLTGIPAKLRSSFIPIPFIGFTPPFLIKNDLSAQNTQYLLSKEAFKVCEEVEKAKET